MTNVIKSVSLVFVCLALVACSDDSEADRRGVGSECAASDDCTETGQVCLTQFKGGYCGVAACTVDADCPGGSGCVTHTDGNNYCFLICDTKAQCNTNRTTDNESNCSASITWADTDMGKACVPPSGT